MMATELKPCPFCGGKAIFLGGSLQDHRMVYIACKKGCVEQCFIKSREEAIEAWNRRTSEIVKVETSFYDKEETYPDCTVQVLTNTATGETSVGWWKNEESLQQL